MDIAVLRRMLDGIFAEGADEPPQRRFVTADFDVILYMQYHIFAVELRHALKRRGDVLHGF